MDLIVELLKEINVAQIAIILFGIWFFYSRLDRKITDTKNELKNLADKVEDIDRRLCRIEGSLSHHGHCLFKQPNEKAE